MTDCQYCGEPVLAGEQAPQLPRLHIECFNRMFNGGLNHLLRRCGCYGGAEDPDPPAMTKREAAQAAFEYLRTGELPEPRTIQ